MEELKDISKIRVNGKLPPAERVRDYEEKIGDPNHFMAGGVEVRCVYADGGHTLNDRLRELIRTQ